MHHFSFCTAVLYRRYSIRTAAVVFSTLLERHAVLLEAAALAFKNNVIHSAVLLEYKNRTACRSNGGAVVLEAAVLIEYLR